MARNPKPNRMEYAAIHATTVFCEPNHHRSYRVAVRAIRRFRKKCRFDFFHPTVHKRS